MKWFIYVCLLVFSVSCSPHMEKEKVEKPKDRIVSRDEAIGGLLCFKCHSYQRFASSEKRVFSHLIHRDSGYHCNQCHSFKAHNFMKTNTSLCNDCHKLTIFIYSVSGFPAKFNHETHARAGCKECHPGIFEMKKGAGKITMDSIYQGRFCGACHNGKKAFSSSECALCHEMKTFRKAVLYKVEGLENVSFSHEFHTQMFDCDTCHPKIFAMRRHAKKMTMDDMYQGKFCGSCHNGNIASAVTTCTKCHKG